MMMPARPPTVAPFPRRFRQALEAAKALARAERDGGNREAAPTLRGLQLPGPFLLAGAARHGLNSTPKR
jgi:hypothetical protein